MPLYLASVLLQVLLLFRISATNLEEVNLRSDPLGDDPSWRVSAGSSDNIGTALYPCLEALCQLTFIHPPTPAANGSLAVVRQPFSVAIEISLAQNVDYSDWRVCQRVDDNGILYCLSILLSNEGIYFSAIDSLSPPEYDSLDPSMDHYVDVWFERTTSGRVEGPWGRSRAHFRAGPRPLRDITSGAQRYLVNDQAHPPISVSGLIVEPRAHPRLEYVIRNMVDQLPVVSRACFDFGGPITILFQ